MDDQALAFRPPYLPFSTFWGFLGEVAGKPLPPQIDRSLLSSKSGTDQAGLLSAMKGFGFISEDQKVESLLEEFARQDSDGRAKLLGSLIREQYPLQIKIADDNGTEKQLLDSFEEAFGYTGATRRKAATFFLHAARVADIMLSPHFPATRSGSGAAGTPRKRSSSRRRPETPTPPAPPSTSGDTYKVQLECGGTVTLTVSVSHFALSKNRQDRDFVNDLIDKLTDYGEVEATEGAEAPEAAEE